MEPTSVGGTDFSPKEGPVGRGLQTRYSSIFLVKRMVTNLENFQ